MYSFVIFLKNIKAEATRKKSGRKKFLGGVTWLSNDPISGGCPPIKTRKFLKNSMRNNRNTLYYTCNIKQTGQQ